LWRDHPFQPHAVARLRTSAYQWDVLFAYLDNVIAWGDDRFRRDTRESLVEATTLYVQAAKILGPRPRTVQRQSQPSALTYRSMVGRWNDFGDAWYMVADSPYIRVALEQLESPRHHNGPGRTWTRSNTDAIATLSGIGLTCFCVPSNDKLLDYWNLV